MWEIEGDHLWLGPDVTIDDHARRPPVFKTSDPTREREIQTRIERDPARITIDVEVRGAIGRPHASRHERPRPRRGGGRERRARGRAQDPARRGPRARDAMDRLGDTPFELGMLTVALPPGAILPVSSLNRARRALTDALVRSLDRGHATTEITAATLPRPAYLGARGRARCSVATSTKPSRRSTRAPAPIGLDCSGSPAPAKPSVRFVRAAPTSRSRSRRRCIQPGEEKIDRFLRSLAPSMLYVRGLGLATPRAQTTSITRLGDFSLNVTNHVTAREVAGRGLVAFTPSFDLDATRLVALLDDELAPRAEVVLHHPMPLFHMGIA
ncbi:MAG: DUF3656 domain-containing protein [Polyangiales bacterium]